MKKIILAFDSFKGCLSSNEISAAARQAILEVVPNCEVVTIAIADGGEGTTAAICSNIKAKKVNCEVHDPLMNLITAEYAISDAGNVAVIELAAASGLPLVSEPLRNPMNTTTLGTGELIKDAVNRGCKKIILGVGGSATNDAGMGILSALGCRFYDSNGKILSPTGSSLGKIAEIDSSALSEYDNIEFIVACDVNNPLYGLNGAAYIYAPQKGASPHDVAVLDAGLQNFAKVVEAKTGRSIAEIPRSGAAGGVGGGIAALLNARLVSGIETILSMTDFDKHLEEASLVITGEGSIDAQTGMGKALSGIVAEANKKNVPVVAIAGAVNDAIRFKEFVGVFSIQQSPITLEEAMNRETALNNIKVTITQIIRLISRYDK